MKLNSVKIKNYRSIEFLEIDFGYSCRVLVGINESGKTNILKALQLLDEEVKPLPEDVRNVATNESELKEAYVKYYFDFDSENIDNMYEEFKDCFLGLNKTEIILKKDGKNILAKQFCAKFNKGIYHVDILTGAKNARYAIITDYQALDNWKKIADTCPEDYKVKLSDDTEVPLKYYKFVNINEYKDIPEEYLQIIKSDDISKAYGTIVCSEVSENLIDVLFWKHSEENILPSKINLESFKNSPESCKPLKNMFELAGIYKIKEKIDEELAKPKGLKNLLSRISKKCSDHLHSTWKEYNQVNFDLIPNGTDIDISIKDIYNNFDLAQRSDGFKKFVTFLLMVSTKVKTNSFENLLILIDEPDVSLHPKGARYLRDELIKIAQKNYVVYSTHSIFMIDQKEIQRHIIVSKKKEKTQIETAKDHNIVKEEVICNALGFSYFESLKEKNILFEGWKDEKLFNTAIEKIPTEHQKIKGAFKDVGICNAKGVKGMRSITALLELAGRKVIIVSDCDKIASDFKKAFIEEHGYGEWFLYSDIDEDLKVTTGEDFIKNKVVIDIVNKIKLEKGFSIELSESDFTNKSKITAIKKWLNDNKVPDEKTKEVLEEIKNDIFINLKISDIEDYYYEFLEKLMTHI
ncbi:MAG: AAA family ATPase [Patescibacteria group bacterium]